MLVYISAFISPHTIEFGEECSKFYDKVIFINMMNLTDERKEMGYDVTSDKIEILSYDNEPDKCQKLILNAKDVIMAGTFYNAINERVRSNKSVYIAHERIFKKGLIKWADPRTWKLMNFCRQVRKKPVYLLAIGIPAAKDFRFLGFKKEKIFQFGYFPVLSDYKVDQLKRKHDGCRILWVGRMVRFKRPLMAIKAVKKLPPNFKLTMIGNGPLLAKAQKYTSKCGMSVMFLGKLPNEQVKNLMCQSDILLSTSNRGEGWGAVINEGMNCGCAIVCSNSIGCAGSLADSDNAILYHSHSVSDLINAIVTASKHQKELGSNALKTVVEQYNAHVAAERFFEVTSAPSSCKGIFEDGLLSRVFK